MSNSGTTTYPGTLDSFVLIGTADYKDGTATSHRAIHNQTMSLGTAIAYTLGTTAGTAVLKNFTAGKFAARTDGETLTTVSITSGTASGILLGTSQVTGGTASGMTLTTASITSGTASGILLGTSQITGGTVANATIGTPAITGGTIQNVLLGTSQITGGTVSQPVIILNQGTTPVVTAEGDIRWDTDNDQIKIGDGAGSKVFSDDSVNAATYTKVSGGTLNNGIIGTSAITGGTVAGATMTTATMTSGTISGVLIGTAQHTGGTAAGMTMTTATMTSGTISGVLLGTSQITGGTVNTATMGTPTITGGNWNAGTLGTPVINVGSDANYDVYYRSTAGAFTRLASGTAATGKFLKSGGTAAAPSWDTPTGAGDMGTATYDPAGIAQQLVGTSATQTMTNKTLSSPTITGTVAGTTVFANFPEVAGTPDADNELANKAYVDANAGGVAYAYMNDQALINGNFDVWQRNTSFTQNDDLFIADRWNSLQEANSSWNFSRSTDVPTVDSSYSLLGTCVTANNQCGIVQILENVDSLKLTGGTVSLSFWAKTSAAAIANLRATVLSWSSTADAVTSDVVGTWASDGTDPTWATNWTSEAAGVNKALTTSWQQFTMTNIAIDTASTNNIAVVIWVDDGTIAQGDAFYVTQVKLNRGATITTFNPLTFQEELRACMRYYEKSFIYSTAPADAVAADATWDWVFAFDTSTAQGAKYYTVEKRTTPTITLYNERGGTGALYHYFLGGGWAQSTSTSAYSTNSKRFTIRIGSSAAFTNEETIPIQGHWTAAAEL